MESKLLVLIFLGSALASDFFVDIENENPLSRTLCCLTANAQSKCATNCANQDCAATCTVRLTIDEFLKIINSITLQMRHPVLRLRHLHLLRGEYILSSDWSIQVT